MHVDRPIRRSAFDVSRPPIISSTAWHNRPRSPSLAPTMVIGAAPSVTISTTPIDASTCQPVLQERAVLR